MIDDPNIDPAIAVRIEAELAEIEHSEGVRILLAIESGSRAWRFPSRDSDYDVRFLYARPAEDYLRITARRDVIERPVDAVFDVNGWDISKALGLALRSNAALLEWLVSPVCYRAASDVPERLRVFARAAANPAAISYHYLSLGRRSLADIDAAEGTVRLKTYCYALRAALALSWLRANGSPPPMDVPALRAGVGVPEDVEVAITALIARKRDATEREMTARDPVIETWLRGVLEAPAEPLYARLPKDLGDQADALFRSILAGVDATNAVTASITSSGFEP